MTDLKFTILEKLYFAEHRQMYKTPLFEECRKQYQLPEIYAALKDLDQDDLVDADLNSDVAKLTKNGRVIYESVKEERQYQLECKQRELDAEQRARDSDALARRSIRLTKISNIVAIGSIIVTILSSAITLILFFFQ
jgi:dynactin complex subunit